MTSSEWWRECTVDLIRITRCLGYSSRISGLALNEHHRMYVSPVFLLPNVVMDLFYITVQDVCIQCISVVIMLESCGQVTHQTVRLTVLGESTMKLALLRTGIGKENSELPQLQRISSLELTAPQIAAQINASRSSSNWHLNINCSKETAWIRPSWSNCYKETTTKGHQ